MSTTTISQSILYIGKDKNVFKMLFESVREEIDIYHVDTPIIGFAWLRTQPIGPSLILIEQNSQGISAYAFGHLLKQRFPNKEIRIAILADEMKKIDIEKANKNNIVEIFLKPLSEKQIGRLNSLLDVKINVFEKKEKLPPKLLRIPLWKRSFDILATGTALLLLSPLLLIVAILIKIDSKGPIFYKSKRVGRGYEVFDFYKFRTMRTGADKELEDLKKDLNQYQVSGASPESMSFECFDCNIDNCTKLAIDNQVVCEKQYMQLSKDNNSAFVKLKNDPRITKLGQFLRNTSIDELPQLLNILKGDMSVVGNRPLPLYEAEELTTDKGSPRFLAPAGLTGLWQVRKRGKGEMSEEERKSLDNEYALNYSFMMDIKLIIQTLGVFVQKENV